VDFLGRLCGFRFLGRPGCIYDWLGLGDSPAPVVLLQLLRSLHWLPVKHRVTYKMASLTFKTMSSATPAYLSDLIQTAVPVRPLRSSDSPAVPRTWNSLYHLSLDSAVLWTLSNDTSRPTCSDSLNLMPPPPLYLPTLRRYTNPILFLFIYYYSASEVANRMMSSGLRSKNVWAWLLDIDRQDHSLHGSAGLL